MKVLNLHLCGQDFSKEQNKNYATQPHSSTAQRATKNNNTQHIL